MEFRSLLIHGYLIAFLYQIFLFHQEVVYFYHNFIAFQKYDVLYKKSLRIHISSYKEFI